MLPIFIRQIKPRLDPIHRRTDAVITDIDYNHATTRLGKLVVNVIEFGNLVTMQVFFCVLRGGNSAPFPMEFR